MIEKKEFIQVGRFKTWHLSDLEGKSTMCSTYTNLEWTGRITAVHYTDKLPARMCAICRRYATAGYPREVMKAYVSRRDHRGVNS